MPAPEPPGRSSGYFRPGWPPRSDPPPGADIPSHVTPHVTPRDTRHETYDETDETSAVMARATPLVPDYDEPAQPAPEQDLERRLRQYELDVAELRKDRAELRKTVATLTETVTAALQHTGDQELLRELRQTETELRELREAIRSLAENTAEASARALDRAQVVITHSRSYWIRTDDSHGVHARLAAVEHQLMDMQARSDVPRDSASAVTDAVVKIGAATMFAA